MRIAVVTDSTADIPPQLAASYGIRVVPLNVRFGLDAYLDGVTMKAEEFYQRLEQAEEFPTTSQPSVVSFVEVYKELGVDHDAVLSLHLSSKLSATHTAAVQARDELGGEGPRVEVVDTLQASMALGWAAIGVAEAVQAGASVDDALEVARDISARARFLGLVETLEYLYKGGRIGKASLYLGSLLRLKPMLELKDGIVHPLDRARSKNKGIDKIKGIIARDAPLSHLAIMYTTEPQLAEEVAADTRRYVTTGEVTVARQGPVVGTYLGPGMLGAGYVKARE